MYDLQNVDEKYDKKTLPFLANSKTHMLCRHLKNMADCGDGLHEPMIGIVCVISHFLAFSWSCLSYFLDYVDKDILK